MTSEETYYYKVAEHYFKIVFVPSRYNDEEFLLSYRPFRVPPVADEMLLFTVTVDDKMPPFPQHTRERMGEYDSNNGTIIIDRASDGAYQFVVKDGEKRSCSLLHADKTFHHCGCALNGTRAMRSLGLNNALMMATAFAGAARQTLLIHASLVRHHGVGYAFTAVSGTGKSTHVNLWMRNIDDCDIMNDDNPLVRVIDGKAYVYGSPWSGKTPCYRDVKAPLGAITRVVRGKANVVEPLEPKVAFVTLISACSALKCDATVYNNMCTTISKVLEATRVYAMYCLPDDEAAKICNSVLSR